MSTDRITAAPHASEPDLVVVTRPQARVADLLRQASDLAHVLLGAEAVLGSIASNLSNGVGDEDTFPSVASAELAARGIASAVPDAEQLEMACRAISVQAAGACHSDMPAEDAT